MLDFTSALYLGFSHPSASLAPWRALTLGRPAALEEHARRPGAGARAGAVLMAAKPGILYPSTLHLFRDVFQVAASKEASSCSTPPPIRSRAGGRRRRQLDGIPAETFPHHDAARWSGGCARRAAPANVR